MRRSIWLELDNATPRYPNPIVDRDNRAIVLPVANSVVFYFWFWSNKRVMDISDLTELTVAFKPLKSTAATPPSAIKTVGSSNIFPGVSYEDFKSRNEYHALVGFTGAEMANVPPGRVRITVKGMVEGDPAVVFLASTVFTMDARIGYGTSV